MKKQILLLITIFTLTINVNAQDTIRHLIFSAWYGGGPPNSSWIQLTNVGDSSIDLSKFRLNAINATRTALSVVNGVPNYIPNFSLKLSGQLGAGESYLLINVSDVLRQDGHAALEQMIPIADYKNHMLDNGLFSDTINPALELWGKDSVDNNLINVLFIQAGNWCNYLTYMLPNGDSVMIDQVNMVYNPATNNRGSFEPSSVAGVTDATLNNILVRKANIKEGNMNWDYTRGVTPSSSEWQVIPRFQTWDIFTIIKNFGDFHVNLQSSTVGIDLNNKILDIPWGTRKDSLIHEFTIGPGMAWYYVEDTIETADSAHVIVQNGDIFNIYACGNTLEEIDFKVNVLPPANDMALVFPKRMQVYFSSAPGTQPVWGPTPYYVTVNNPIIDTIGNVLFATRTDTLYKYLEWAPDASADILWVDGENRVDLKRGDILKITAANGNTVKEYFIDVQDYQPSSNVLLSAIIWPDKEGYMEGWNGDTIPLFNPVKNNYTITLPYGSETIPALVALPQNLRTKISQERAVSLKGSIDERTTVFNVVAEDDTTTTQYSVTFNIDIPDNLIQKYYADPIVSEMGCNYRSWFSFFELVNPGNTPLDLSQYLIVSSQLSLNPAEAIINSIQAAPSETNFTQRYRSYVPGYKYSDDTLQWISNPGKLYIDPNIDPVLEPGNVFTLAASRLGRDLNITDEDKLKINKWWNDQNSANRLTPEGVDPLYTPAMLKRNCEALFIFKILNDSILNGTKEVGDPNDFKLVDVFADALLDGSWKVAGRSVAANTVCRIIRKPFAYKGVTTIGEGLGTSFDDSDWIVEINGQDFFDVTVVVNDMGVHNLNPVTAYKSTISSLTYLVSDGFTGLKTIQGDLSGKTVDAFYGNITRADTGQSLTVKSGINGSVKAIGDLIANNDTLVVLSADNANTTKYLLIDLPLDTDALLVAKGGSGYTIVVTGDIGTVSGILYGTTLEEVLGNVIKPSLATMSVIDQNGSLVPVNRLNFHSDKVKTPVGDSIYFEVVAQDGISKITYKLNPDALSSDAFVISSLFDVDAVNHSIAGLPFGISVFTFMTNIEAVRGATLKLVDKIGHERETGIMSYDDKLIVTSQDQSNTVTYILSFISEPVNMAPMVEAYYDGSVIYPGTQVQIKAHVQDDGRPIPLTYLWEVIEGNIADVSISSPNDTITNVSFAAAGTYKLKITVTDGELVNADTISLIVNFALNVSGSDAPVVSIYPNPASSNINIELQNFNDNLKTVKVFDVAGRAIYNYEFSGSKVVIDAGKFEGGLYIISLKSGNYHTIRQISIIK